MELLLQFGLKVPSDYGRNEETLLGFLDICTNDSFVILSVKTILN